MGRARILLSVAACAIGALLIDVPEPGAQTAAPAPAAAAPAPPAPTIPIPPAATPVPAAPAPAAPATSAPNAPPAQGAALPSAYGPMQDSLMAAPAAGKQPT